MSNPDAAYDGVVAAIRQAKTEVRLQVFSFEGSSAAADKVLKAIADKQRENPAFKAYLELDGDFTPTAETIKVALEKHHLDAEVASHVKWPSRAIDHTKTTIVDGTTGFVGSANLEKKHMKQVVMQVSGPVVDTLLSDFDTAWREAPIHFSVRNGLVLPSEIGADLPLAAHPDASRADDVPMTWLSKDNDKPGEKDSYDNDADQGLLAALAAATTEIHVETPNSNDPRVIQALADAANRGVKVEVMLPRTFNELTSRLDGGNNIQFAQRIPQRLSEEGRAHFELRYYSPDGKTDGWDHIKYLEVDGQWAYVGSQNADQQSWKHSREAGLGIDDSTQAQKLDAAIFQPDWAIALPHPL
jgi:phosphatidylserine/phosphatidylglycerophosphate/cardiolipin synthase-like enzyme